MAQILCLALHYLCQLGGPPLTLGPMLMVLVNGGLQVWIPFMAVWCWTNNKTSFSSQALFSTPFPPQGCLTDTRHIYCCVYVYVHCQRKQIFHLSVSLADSINVKVNSKSKSVFCFFLSKPSKYKQNPYPFSVTVFLCVCVCNQDYFVPCWS